MFSSFAKAIATFGMIVLAFITNALSNVMPLNGQTVGDISNTVFREVLITPANYAFAIWGVIYLGVFAFGIYQLSPSQRHNRQLDSLRSLMFSASGAQTLWIFLFLSRQYVWSVVAMLGIWVALMLGYRQLAQAKPFNLKQTWCVQLPWSVYFGWISVATLLNVALALFSLGWRGGWVSPQMWTIALMAIAMGLGIILVWNYRDIAFAGVLMWALVAIAVRHQDIPILSVTGLGSSLVLGLLSLYRGFRPQMKKGRP